MRYRTRVVVMMIALTTLITYGCTGAPTPEPEPEESVAPAPVEPEVVFEPVENESPEDDEDSDVEVDASTGASAVPGARSDANSAVTIICGVEAKEIYEFNDAVVLLDVRNQDEFDEISIPGSVLIPVDELESRLSELPDKDAIIIVYCRAGRRSEVAANILAENGFTNIFNMETISNWV